MSAEVFIDTNILVYCYDTRSPEKQRVAIERIADAVQRRVACVSFQVVQEFINCHLKGANPRFTADDCKSFIAMAKDSFEVVRPTWELYSKALTLQEEHRLSWYDSLILAAAMFAGCSKLLTEDFSHGQRFGGVEIVNPFRVR
jgi:predicted nucleic acid-binding protein